MFVEQPMASPGSANNVDICELVCDFGAPKNWLILLCGLQNILSTDISNKFPFHNILRFVSQFISKFL